MDTMGIIFSNIYDSLMGALTEVRTSASIPVGGRYRQIDFILSAWPAPASATSASSPSITTSP